MESKAPGLFRVTPYLRLQGVLHPGQRTSIDHFICSTKDRRIDSTGKKKEEKMLRGGVVFVDHASDFVFVDFCISPNSHETLRSKKKYEAFCRDVGVVPPKYFTDNGRAFTSREFEFSLSDFHQTSDLSGVGAHHSNGKAENTIKRTIARTMMIHSAIYWPDVADSTLCPLAVEYATYLHNHVPQASNGLAPIDIFTRTRHPVRRLMDLSVWGSPTYVLDKVISEGKKLPRWKPRSTRRMFVGLSKPHSSKAPLVLNLETGFIIPQFHVVHDEFFATVTSMPETIPDFNSDVWKALFGSATHYLSDDLYNEEPDREDVLEQDRMQHKSERIADRFDSQLPLVCLPIPPQPTTRIPETDTDFVRVRDPVQVRENNYSDFLLVDPLNSTETVTPTMNRSGNSSRVISQREGAYDASKVNSKKLERFNDSILRDLSSEGVLQEGVVLRICLRLCLIHHLSWIEKVLLKVKLFLTIKFPLRKVFLNFCRI